MLRLAAIAVSLLWVSVQADAAGGIVCTPMPQAYKDYRELRDRVCEGDVDAAEKYMAQRQRDYEAGKIDERTLISSYLPFATPISPAFFTNWLARYPDSYSAHVAAAGHQLALGWQARGDKAARDTSKEDFELMHRRFSAARRYLERSISLTKKPTATYPMLINIGMHYGRTCTRRGSKLTPNPCQRDLLDKALEADPKAYWARRYYMDSVRPRWGGSFEAMEAFAGETQKADLVDWQAKRFLAMVFEERAFFEQRPEEKLKLALQARELNYSVVNLHEIIHALLLLERPKDVIPYATQYLELAPATDWVLMRRGVAFWLLGKNAEAYEDFLAASKAGNAFSQNKVGYFLWTGTGVKQNQAEAVGWWQKAAANGDKDGIKNLAHAKAQGFK